MINMHVYGQATIHRQSITGCQDRKRGSTALGQRESRSQGKRNETQRSPVDREMIKGKAGRRHLPAITVIKGGRIDLGRIKAGQKQAVIITVSGEEVTERSIGVEIERLKHGEETAASSC